MSPRIFGDEESGKKKTTKTVSGEAWMEILGVDASLARFGCQGRHLQTAAANIQQSKKIIMIHSGRKRCTGQVRVRAEARAIHSGQSSPERTLRQHGTTARSSPSAGKGPIR